MLFPESIPTLSTNRLILRPLEPSDAPRLFHNFSDDSVTEFYDLYTFQSMDEAEKLAQTWINCTDQKEGLRWTITFADPKNHASRALLNKCRLKTEGVLRDYFFEKERFVDAELLSVLNPTR